MVSQTPTIIQLFENARRNVRTYYRVLFLLCLGAGILIRIAFYPAEQVLIPVFKLLNESSSGDTAAMEQAILLLNESAFTLLVSQLAVVVATAIALVPWVRVIQVSSNTVFSGGAKAYARRCLRCFLHLLAAVGLTLLMVMITLIIAELIGQVNAALGLIGLFMALVLAFWFSFFFTSVAHVAITNEVLDKRETLNSALLRLKLMFRPIIACLAIIFLAVTLFNFTIGNLIVALMPGVIQNTIGIILGGGFMFLISALHIAAITILPNPRDILET